ncbi:unnamed protein product [Timema podura]|uniref:Uncharacterized protein n=1 Tax=Timema podura TaxID=61482 RepID=A0ABN7NCM8_TIMPD|nr:unnamed protein product [Timema podura]
MALKFVSRWYFSRVDVGIVGESDVVPGGGLRERERERKLRRRMNERKHRKAGVENNGLGAMRGHVQCSTMNEDKLLSRFNTSSFAILVTLRSFWRCQKGHVHDKLGKINLEEVHPHFREERVDNHLGKKNTLITPNRDSNPDLLVIGNLIYCESGVLDHTDTEVDMRQALNHKTTEVDF